MEIISINKIDDYKNVNFEGFIIESESKIISILIDNSQLCCEDWGYVSSDDDFKNFIGAKILEIKLVDKNLATSRIIKNFAPEILEDAEFIFINVETSKGLLQFALYNCHNGYYSHDCEISIKDKKSNKKEIIFQDGI